MSDTTNVTSSPRVFYRFADVDTQWLMEKMKGLDPLPSKGSGRVKYIDNLIKLWSAERRTPAPKNRALSAHMASLASLTGMVDVVVS